MRVRAQIAIGIVLAIAILAYGLRFKDIGLTPRILIGGVLTIAVIAWLVSSRAPVFRRQPASARIAFFVTAAVGIALVAGTMARGLNYLDAKEVPRGEAPAVGFVPPAPAKLHRGFALGMGIRAASCDKPVHVTLVASGSAEYWADNERPLRRGGNFKLGIPGTVEHLHYGMGENLSDVTNPIDGTPSPEDTVPLERKRVRTVHDMTVASAHVPEWGRYKEPVVAHFDAYWLESRGRGNCYLRLPTLSGDNTAFATEVIAGRAKRDPMQFPCYEPGKCMVMTSERNGLSIIYRPQEEIVRGSIVAVAESGGDIIADDSIPAPDAVIEGDLAWTCDSTPQTVSRADRPFSIRDIKQQVASDCSGFAVVAERDAGDRRDATILMMGILIAVGLGLLIEGVMDWMRAEFPLREKRNRGKAETRS